MPPIKTHETSVFDLSNFERSLKYAEMIFKSSFAPRSYKSPADILAAVAYGAEVGLGPMQALQSIAVINGKPSIYGDAMLALVRKSGLLETIKEWIDGDTAYCELVRVGNPPRVFTFSKAEAKTAGLLGKPGPWTTYPNRMLMFRARGFGLRDCFGDVLNGLISSEEAEDYPAIEEPKKKNKETTKVIDITPSSQEQISPEKVEQLKGLIELKGVPADTVIKWLDKAHANKVEEFTEAQADALIELLKSK